MNFGLPSSFELDQPDIYTTLKKTSKKASSAHLSTSYRLHGVVNHLGFNASGGHFLTDVYDAEAERWLRCDDSLVTDVSSWNHLHIFFRQFSGVASHVLIMCTFAFRQVIEESVLANVREAYMFFYVHESVSEETLTEILI